MPFGSGDRVQIQQILEQLGKLATDLAAVKQQVADQQHMIDQARQDATAAITSGLAEIRAVAREALGRTSDVATGHLANIGSELVAIRGVVGQLDTRLRETLAPASGVKAAGEGPAADPEPQPIEQPAPEPKLHVEPASEPDPDILRAAAGIAHATVEAHRDTWAFLIQVAGNEEHFHIPGRVEDHEGFVSVRFSGPSLVAAITSLDHVHHTAESPVTRAIAAHIHGKITTAVQEIIDRPGRDGDGTPVRIVIDDRAAADEAPDSEQ
ncbi:hypothetical protein SUDANB15_07520 (plasmid) [Streptomyces sp. enrichment culture]|uniref:hypothetical protein n=1 Tax=Streptomyces sp. enrichment culture TaxID=1795815 RepID=UPI003F543CC4